MDYATGLWAKGHQHPQPSFAINLFNFEPQAWDSLPYLSSMDNSTHFWGVVMIHYPFSKYLWSVYCVLGIVLDTEDKAVNIVLALSLCSSVGKQQYTDRYSDDKQKSAKKNNVNWIMVRGPKSFSVQRRHNLKWGGSHVDMGLQGGQRILGKNAVQRPPGGMCGGWHTCHPHLPWGPLASAKR